MKKKKIGFCQKTAWRFIIELHRTFLDSHKLVASGNQMNGKYKREQLA